MPYSLAPTLKCPDGKIVKLVSRGCPHLDDYEPNERSVAATAVVQTPPAADLRRTDVVICEGRSKADSDWGSPEDWDGPKDRDWNSQTNACSLAPVNVVEASLSSCGVWKW